MGDIMRRWKNKRKARGAQRILLCALMLLYVTLFLQWAFNKSEPLILPLAEREFADLVTGIVYEATKDIELQNIVVPHYGNDGNVTHMSTDTIAINNAVTIILNSIEKRLGNEDIKIAIPIGDIVGDALSLGQGPDILVELNQYKSTKAETKSSFESAGINQTLHRLLLELEIEAVVLLPGLKPGHITAFLSVPIAETLIVGDTPSTYITRN